MTPEQDQQLLKSLETISADMKTLATLVVDLLRQQATADDKAYSQLVNIAHKR
jgi:hypothetical protein